MKFRQETGVIIPLIVDPSKKDIKNMQSHIDNELNEDYKALQENWGKRQSSDVVIRQNNEIRQRSGLFQRSNSWQESVNNKTNEPPRTIR